MKKILSLIAITCIILSCDVPINPSVNSEYWGCWTESTGKKLVYDIILTEKGPMKHRFEFGIDCESLKTPIFLDSVTFRNDTLIVDNGFFEYWCFIENHIMYCSSYSKDSKIEAFVKL